MYCVQPVKSYCTYTLKTTEAIMHCPDVYHLAPHPMMKMSQFTKHAGDDQIGSFETTQF